LGAGDLHDEDGESLQGLDGDAGAFEA